MVYDITSDTVSLLVFIAVRMAGMFVVFSIYGFAAHHLRIDLKYSNLIYVITLLLSFTILYFSNYNIYALYLFIFIYGAAVGVFWIGQHNYILNTLDSKTTDIYSSILGVGKEINTLLVPSVAVSSFYISEHILKWGAYDIFVIVLFFSTLFMTFKVGVSKSYKVKKVSLKRFIKHAKKEKYLKELFIYNLARGLKTPLFLVFASYVALEALKTPINIGVVEIVTSLITIYVSIYISSAKHSTNRLKLMLMSIALYTISFVILMLLKVSAIGYVIFVLVSIVSNPLFKTTETLIDIRTMGLLYVGDSYHLGIMLRETLLIVGRVVMVIALITIFNISDDIVLNVFILGTFSSVLMFTQYLMASRIYSKNKLTEQQ